MKNRADRFAGPWLGLCAVFPFLLFLPLGANAQHEHDTHERCGQRSALANLVAQRPELLYELEAYQRAIPELVESGGAFPRSGAVLVIPVVFHVIHSGQAVGNGPNLSDARIQQQIAQTNLDYRRQNSDAANTPALFQNIVGDMEIEFCLATVDPNGNPTSGITRHSYNIANQNTIDYTIKGQTNWDPTRYLNVWTVSMPNDLNGVLGYAYPPLTSIVGTDLDGVVLNYLHTGVNAAANPDSEGRTFTHEVGHYLGLPHPWSDINGNGGCVVDDGINDTPQSDDAFYGCPGFPQFSCGNSAMFMNFMDYVDDDCMNSFTLGQKAVMRAVLQGNTVHNGANYRGRASVLANAVTACSIVDPGACLYLPFTPMQMGFEAGQSTAAWTIENTNGDQNNNQPVTWAAATNPNNGDYGPNNGNGFARYFYNTNATTAANDWLFTPCFEVEDQHTYRLNFSYACASNGGTVYPERLKVALATAAASGSVFTVLADYPNVNNAYPAYTDAALDFTINGNGEIYLGFQAYSAADQYVLQLDDIGLVDITPGAATEGIELPAFDVSVYPNPASGDFSVDFSFDEGAQDVRLTLVNLLGQPVWELSRDGVQRETIQVPTAQLAAGLYSLQVSADGAMVTRKVVLSK
jgi:hypothetical protein